MYHEVSLVADNLNLGSPGTTKVPRSQHALYPTSKNTHSTVRAHDLKRTHTRKYLRHSRHSRPGRRQLPNAIITSPIHFRRPNHFDTLSANFQHRVLSPTFRYSTKPDRRQQNILDSKLALEREPRPCSYELTPTASWNAKQPP